MDLRDIVKDVDNISVASERDNASILNYFNNEPMEAEGLSIQYRRDPDFFEFLRYQSEDFRVVCGTEDEGGKVAGVGSYSIRPGYIAGEKTWVGYLGDLRVGHNRKIIRAWRKVYSKILESGGGVDGKNADYYLTAVLDDNQAAKKALIMQRKSDFIYDPVTDYNIIQIFGRKPFATSANKSRHHYACIRQAKENDLPALEAFLGRVHKDYLFGFDFEGGELRRRLANWPGLNIDDFVIAEHNGKILACTAVWAPPAKKMIISSLPTGLKVFLKGLNATVARKKPFPLKQECLSVGYLTHLCLDLELMDSDRQNLFRDLFNFVYDTNMRDQRNYHCLAFHDLKCDDYLGYLGDFFTHIIPAKLYAVRHKEQKPVSTFGLEVWDLRWL